VHALEVVVLDEKLGALERRLRARGVRTSSPRKRPSRGDERTHLVDAALEQLSQGTLLCKGRRAA